MIDLCQNLKVVTGSKMMFTDYTTLSGQVSIQAKIVWRGAGPPDSAYACIHRATSLKPTTPAKKEFRVILANQAHEGCPLRGSNTIPPDLVTETSVWRSPN
jgi:hypothetical protein